MRNYVETLIHSIYYWTTIITLNGLYFNSAMVNSEPLESSTDPAVLNNVLEALAVGDLDKLTELENLNSSDYKEIPEKIIDIQMRKLQQEFGSICADVTRFNDKFRTTVEAANKAGDQFLSSFEAMTTEFMDAFDKDTKMHLKKTTEVKTRMSYDGAAAGGFGTLIGMAITWLFGETLHCKNCAYIGDKRCRSEIESEVGERFVDRFVKYWNTSVWMEEYVSCDCDIDNACLRSFRKGMCEMEHVNPDCRVFPMGKLGGPIGYEKVKTRMSLQQEDLDESKLYADLTPEYIVRLKEHLDIVKKVRHLNRRAFIIIENALWHKILAESKSIEERWLYKLGGYGNVDHTPLNRLLLLRHVIKSGSHKELSVDQLLQD